MGCKTCGAQDIGTVLGTCLRCTATAGVSSVVFWMLYTLSLRFSMPGIVQWGIAAFAALVTLLFVGHVAGHLSRLRADADKPTNEE
jgi:hypothetical protein